MKTMKTMPKGATAILITLLFGSYAFSIQSEENRTWKISDDLSVDGTIVKSQCQACGNRFKPIYTIRKPNGELLDVTNSKFSYFNQKLLNELGRSTEYTKGDPIDLQKLQALFQADADWSLVIAQVRLGQSLYGIPVFAVHLEGSRWKAILPTNGNPRLAKQDWFIQTKLSSTNQGQKTTKVIANNELESLFLHFEAPRLAGLKFGDPLSPKDKVTVLELVLPEPVRGRTKQSDPAAVQINRHQSHVVEVVRNTPMLDFKRVNSESWAMVLNSEQQLVGLLLPSVNVRAFRENVHPVSTIFHPNTPSVRASQGSWRESDRQRKIEIFVSTDRILGDRAELQIQELSATDSGFIAGQSEDQVKLPHSTLPLTRQDKYKLKKRYPSLYFSVDQVLYLAELNLPPDSKQSANYIARISIVEGGDSSNTRLCFIGKHDPKRELPIMWGTRFWNNPDDSFELAETITSNSTRVENSAPKEVPSYDGTSISASIPLDAYAVSQNEKKVWTIDNDLKLKEFNLPKLDETRQKNFGGVMGIYGEMHFCASRNHLLVANAGTPKSAQSGILIIDQESLEARHWLETEALKKLTASPSGDFAYAISEKYLYIIDVRNGVLIHRMRNNFSEHYNWALGCGLDDIQVTRDGKYLMGISTFYCRFRIEGSDLIFEERSPIYLSTGRKLLWTSGDGEFWGTTHSLQYSDRYLINRKVGQSDNDVLPVPVFSIGNLKLPASKTDFDPIQHYYPKQKGFRALRRPELKEDFQDVVYLPESNCMLAFDSNRTLVVIPLKDK